MLIGLLLLRVVPMVAVLHTSTGSIIVGGLGVGSFAVHEVLKVQWLFIVILYAILQTRVLLNVKQMVVCGRRESGVSSRSCLDRCKLVSARLK